MAHSGSFSPLLILQDQFFGACDSSVFILFFGPYSCSQYQVPSVIWFRRSLHFNLAHLKSHFHIYFIWKWMNLPGPIKNVMFLLWTQIEPLKVKYFKNIHLDILDFYVNLCLHLTFPKQATYCPQRVSWCNHIFHTPMITKITEVIKSYRGPWSKNYFFDVIHHTYNKEAWLQPFNIGPKEEIAQISWTNQNLMA